MLWQIKKIIKEIQVGEAHENLWDKNTQYCINGGQQFSSPAVVRIHHGVEIGPVLSVPCNGKYKL